MIQRSEVESDKFGIPVFRADLFQNETGSDEWMSLVSLLRVTAPALAIVRTALPSGLSTLWADGIAVRIADAQVLFQIDLADADGVLSIGEINSPFIYSESALPTNTFIEALRESFQGYPLHYAASPELPHLKAPDVYADWALRVSSDSGTFFCMNSIELTVASMAVVTLDYQQAALSILLAGTVPSQRRTGAYTNLLRNIISRAPSLGAKSVTIATRVDNSAVVNAWTKVGMKMSAGTYTLHVWSYRTQG